MSEISIAEVDQALAAMTEAKQRFYDSGKDEALKAEFVDAKNTLNRVRSAWKLQEEEAGRREVAVGGATVGGDAEAEG